MRVLAPAPRIHHKVTESGTGGHERLGAGFDGSRLDDGHENALRRVVTEDHLVFAVCHVGVKTGC